MILVKFLKGNSDVFAWSAMDMPSVDPGVIVHRLNVLMKVKPVKQKKKKSTLQVIEAMREVEYPDWIPNVVMVKNARNR
ncbi:hypothetical protein PVK06_025378 [Gossypium arboreum]|uniref:Uncharacterized protein n=1 Tax=Gossypium arboreum TaxID=29729 RepID=A0ABR0PGQ7_GOSAR|nr:hypothetical protein PVK06_025378 [Gossypium arboreum]